MSESKANNPFESQSSQESKADRTEKRASNTLRGDVKAEDMAANTETLTKDARFRKEFRQQGGRSKTHEDFGTPTIEGIIEGGPPSKATLSEKQIQELGKQVMAKTQDAPILIAQAIGDSTIPPGQQPVLTSTDTAETKPQERKFKVGDSQYNPDEVTAQDWNKIIKQGKQALDQAGNVAGRAGDTAKNPELAEFEQPPLGGQWEHPHRGREDDFIDYGAAFASNQMFPEISSQLGQEKGQIDPYLVAAVIRNEQYYYKNVVDTGPDHYIQKHDNWPFRDTESVGPAQMQVRNINALAKEFSNVLGDPSEAVKNAEDPAKAPMFVAAYFADVIRGIKSEQKPSYINDSTWKLVNEHWNKGEKNEALILAYNPDPKQVNHVFTQMDAIKAPDWD